MPCMLKEVLIACLVLRLTDARQILRVPNISGQRLPDKVKIQPNVATTSGYR